MLVIIPTKNRNKYLKKVLKSLFSQSQNPRKILIIDQSKKSKEKEVAKLFRKTKIKVKYLHTFPDSGLVLAKKRAIEHSKSKITCFLEDDVILHQEFIKNILISFYTNPKILGVGGICENSISKNLFYVALHWLFYCRIFKDSRPKITFLSKHFSKKEKISETLSGGISAWRREVLEAVPFNPTEGFHMMEDMHFSRKVIQRFGKCMLINSHAKLKHFPSKEGREEIGNFEKKRMLEAFKFYRYHGSGFLDLLSLIWLACGLTIFSFCKSIFSKSVLPITGHAKGIFCCLKINYNHL